MFNNSRLISRSEGETKETDNVHIVCLRYKVISSRKDGVDLSIGFRQKIPTREKGLSTTETINKILFCLKLFVRYF